MQHGFLIFCLLVCRVSFGQDLSLNTFLPWFEKAEKQSIITVFQHSDYRLTEEKDSLGFRLIRYTFSKQTTALQPTLTFLIGDSTVEYLSIENSDQTVQRAITVQLKANRFRTLNADVNGNFITTVYDNDRVLVNQDYQAVDNPSGKGQIPSYGYRIYRKYGKFDTMNGEKLVMLSENGTSYLGIRENYKNGVLSGERIFYYPDGKIKRKENYQAGRLNGLVSDYDRQGQLVHSSTHSYHWKYGMEKWYDHQGKVVKTLQWQRDVPVGLEKQTFNGTVVGSIQYVKGVKQGPAKVPVYFDSYIQARYPLDTLNDEPFGIESVNFEHGLRTGKAVCMYFGSGDTMYTCYYKEGKLDSTYTRYGQNTAYFTTNYTNGLENGSRVFRIPSGPLKDTVYRIEPYKNGNLHGEMTQYYRKEEDQIFVDPDPGFHLEGSSSGYPKHVPGQWIPDYYMETYKDGVRNGPFIFWRDSGSYNKGTYVDGKLDGLNEAGMVFGKTWIKVSRHYDKGNRTGEWITENVYDSIVELETYDQNRKHGVYRKRVKGFTSEERVFNHDTLTFILYNEENGDFRYYETEEQNKEFIQLKCKSRIGDTISIYRYIIGIKDYSRKDTVLATVAHEIRKKPEIALVHLVDVEVTTPQFEKSGGYSNGKPDGIIFIKHKSANVLEQVVYENDSIVSYKYTRVDGLPYSGTFISATTGESISVKDGLRHGWSTWKNESGTEFFRMKYVKGSLRKGEASMP